MKKLLLILLCLPMIGFGQGWEKVISPGGGDKEGNSVQQTIDGGYIICGYWNNQTGNSSDVCLIKTDDNGDTLWTKLYGGANSERGYSVQQTIDGGYIVCGGTIDVFLVKTDGNGVEIWNHTFGGTGTDRGYSVQQTTDGGYIVCGGTGSNTTGPWDSDVYLIKTDGNGLEEWNHTFGGTSNDLGHSVKQTTDGGFIISGTTESFNTLNLNGAYSIYLIKTDENGIEQWSHSFGDSLVSGYSVQQTSDGGYIVSGTRESPGNSQSDIYLIKTDGNGLEQWSQILGSLTSNETGYSVQQTSDGGYIITGRKEDVDDYGVDGVSDVYLIKTDGNGIEQWNQTFGGAGYDIGNSVKQTSDGGYIITGETEDVVMPGVNGEKNIYLIKTDANGNATSTFNITINSKRKLQKTVDILGKETKHQTNIPLIEIYDDGTVEKRITID